MKEEVINKFMGKLLSYMQNTEEFLKTETPEYITQLLEYSTLESYINIGGLLFGIITLVILGIICQKFKIICDSDGDSVPYMTILIINCILLLISLIVIPVEVMNIVKIKTAPKVYIVDYIQRKL